MCLNVGAPSVRFPPDSSTSQGGFSRADLGERLAGSIPAGPERALRLDPEIPMNSGALDAPYKRASLELRRLLFWRATLKTAALRKRADEFGSVQAAGRAADVGLAQRRQDARGRTSAPSRPAVGGGGYPGYGGGFSGEPRISHPSLAGPGDDVSRYPAQGFPDMRNPNSLADYEAGRRPQERPVSGGPLSPYGGLPGYTPPGAPPRPLPGTEGRTAPSWFGGPTSTAPARNPTPGEVLNMPPERQQRLSGLAKFDTDLRQQTQGRALRERAIPAFQTAGQQLQSGYNQAVTDRTGQIRRDQIGGAFQNAGQQLRSGFNTAVGGQVAQNRAQTAAGNATRTVGNQAVGGLQGMLSGIRDTARSTASLAGAHAQDLGQGVQRRSQADAAQVAANQPRGPMSTADFVRQRDALEAQRRTSNQSNSYNHALAQKRVAMGMGDARDQATLNQGLTLHDSSGRAYNGARPNEPPGGWNSQAGQDLRAQRQQVIDARRARRGGNAMPVGAYAQGMRPQRQIGPAPGGGMRPTGTPSPTSNMAMATPPAAGMRPNPPSLQPKVTPSSAPVPATPAARPATPATPPRPTMMS